MMATAVRRGERKCSALGSKRSASAEPKARGSWRRGNGKARPYRQARDERSAIESLVFTLREDFEFGEMARRTHENVLGEMLEKVLAYNISQIIRVRKKLSEAEQMDRAAAA